jgi:hypothetical protein
LFRELAAVALPGAYANGELTLQVFSNPTVLHCWIAISTMAKYFSTMQVLRDLIIAA